MASDSVPQAAKDRGTHFTTFIRVPFPRGDFVDPPLVNWDSAKDKALWKILSRKPKGADLDWEDIARKFDVTLPFVLQQASWLYEEVRQQMQKVTQTAASPSEAGAGRTPLISGSPLKRQRSSESNQAPSDAASPGADISKGLDYVSSARSRGNSFLGNASTISRTTSTNTITQSRPNPPVSPGALGSNTSRGGLSVSPRQRQTFAQNARSKAAERLETAASSSEETSGTDSSSEIGARGLLGKSQVFRRAPNFIAGKETRPKGPTGPETDTEDEEPAFFTFGESPGRVQQDVGATGDGKHQALPIREPVRVTKITSREGTDSSVSSAASSAAPMSSQKGSGPGQRRPMPLSPRQRAEIGALSPAKRALGGREGSDGALSMGSSFSDLDDASLTQSALEEALMSNMQHGGIGSRMSNISQAFRSRYTEKKTEI